MLGLFFALALAASPAAGKAPTAITNPHWLEIPSGDEVARVYPARALRDGVGGRVLLTCQVLATGYVSKCRVEDETPADYGFGEAAILLSASFRMAPRTVDGLPVDGAKVGIPIVFKMPDVEPGSDAMSVPDLEMALACYGQFAAMVEADPTNSDLRGMAGVYLFAYGMQGLSKGLLPSEIEANLASARKAGKSDPRCVVFPGVGESIKGAFEP
ncbi:MAG: TonB family protein [Caulobacter sp.]|nr:TonB family protein [Caulobacter sp.]